MTWSCWKHMVPKLIGIGLLDLTMCLCNEQYWQRCSLCNVKVLRNGGETGLPAQVLHMTNQGHSVRRRIRDAMKGRTRGLWKCAPPCECGANLGDASIADVFYFQ